jgi:glutamate racemase
MRFVNIIQRVERAHVLQRLLLTIMGIWVIVLGTRMTLQSSYLRQKIKTYTTIS